MDGLDHYVDLRCSVIKRERRPHRGRHAEALHYRHRAVMSGTYGNALLIENRADVVRMNVIDDERNDSGFLLSRADDSHRVDLGKLAGRIG